MFDELLYFQLSTMTHGCQTCLLARGLDLCSMPVNLRLLTKPCFRGLTIPCNKWRTGNSPWTASFPTATVSIRPFFFRISGGPSLMIRSDAPEGWNVKPGKGRGKIADIVFGLACSFSRWFKLIWYEFIAALFRDEGSLKLGVFVDFHMTLSKII